MQKRLSAAPGKDPAIAADLPSLSGTRASRTEVEELLADLDEKIDEIASDIETLRSREQGAPLELGCALFGLFTIVILVLAFFATIARAFFSSWLFYLVLAVAILAGLYRIGPKVIARSELPHLALQRAEMEASLSRLKLERQRLEALIR